MEERKKGSGLASASDSAGLNSGSEKRKAKLKLYSVHVGNLPRNTSKNELHDLFSGAGTVHEIFINTPADDQEFTYGFVRFVDPECCRKAVMDLNRWLLGGQPIKVELARETVQDRSCREILMRPAPKQYLRKNYEDDKIFLLKVKQMCSHFNQKHEEFTRNLMANEQSEHVRPVSPLPEVNLSEFLKEVQKADPNPTPLMRFDLPRVPLDLEDFDEAFSQSNPVSPSDPIPIGSVQENSARNMGCLPQGEDPSHNIDNETAVNGQIDLNSISPSSVPLSRRYEPLKYQKPGIERYSPGIYELDEEGTHLQNVFAEKSPTGLHCTLTPEGSRIVTSRRDSRNSTGDDDAFATIFSEDMLRELKRVFQEQQTLSENQFEPVLAASSLHDTPSVVSKAQYSEADLSFPRSTIMSHPTVYSDKDQHMSMLPQPSVHEPDSSYSCPVRLLKQRGSVGLESGSEHCGQSNINGNIASFEVTSPAELETSAETTTNTDMTEKTVGNSNASPVPALGKYVSPFYNVSSSDDDVDVLGLSDSSSCLLAPSSQRSVIPPPVTKQQGRDKVIGLNNVSPQSSRGSGRGRGILAFHNIISRQVGGSPPSVNTKSQSSF